jgi:hypothetical protein
MTNIANSQNKKMEETGQYNKNLDLGSTLQILLIFLCQI